MVIIGGGPTLGKPGLEAHRVTASSLRQAMDLENRPQVPGYFSGNARAGDAGYCRGLCAPVEMIVTVE